MELLSDEWIDKINKYIMVQAQLQHMKILS